MSKAATNTKQQRITKLEAENEALRTQVMQSAAPKRRRAPPLQGRAPASERLRDRGLFGSSTGGVQLTDVLDQAKRGILKDWANWCERLMEDIDIAADVSSRVDRVLQSPYVIRPPDGADRPIDVFAADLMDKKFRSIRGLNDSLQRLLKATFTGVQAEAIQWEWDGGVMAPVQLHMRHLRRFRYDDQWKLRLYDSNKRNKHDPDGLLLEPAGWAVHHVSTNIGYPGSDGLFRAVSWIQLFDWWVEKFWIQDRERNGQPSWKGKVPAGSLDEVRQQMLEDIERLVASGAIVLEEGHEVEAMVHAVTAKSGDGYQQYLDRNRKRKARLLTGSDDVSSAGDHGSQAAVETRTEQSVDPKTISDGNRLMETIRRDIFAWFIDFNDWETLARENGIEWDGYGPAVPVGEFGGAAKANNEADDPMVPEVSAAPEQEANDPTPVTVDAGPEAATAETANVQQAALNGAQVTAMMEIVASVARGELPRSSGVELMLVAFPIDRAQAELVMGEVGKTFVPTNPDAPTQQPAAPPVEAKEVAVLTDSPLAVALRALRPLTAPRRLTPPRTV